MSQFAVCVALAAASLLLASTPSFDPWAWLVWGRDLAHLRLAIGDAPSWKPLPALIDAPLTLFGPAAPALWLVVARAGALLAVVQAARLAARWSGWAAGAAAALGLLLTHDYARRAAVGNAEPLMVAAILLAVERHLDGRRGQAFALGVGAALVRPEAWPFLGLYALWAWRERAVPRRAIAAGLAAVPALWFGLPLLATGHAFQASHVALSISPQPGVARLQHHGWRVVGEFTGMLPWWVLAGAALAVVAGPARRRAALVAAAAVVWVAIVAALAQRGYAAPPRYLFAPAAGAALLAGTGLAALARRRTWAIALLAVGVAALSIPDARRLADDRAAVAADGARTEALFDAVDGFGGPRAVSRCGPPLAPWFARPAVAWRIGAKLEDLHVGPDVRPEVVVAYRPPDNWRISGPRRC